MWRQLGEEHKDKVCLVLPTAKHGGGSIMVWGCMSAAGTGKLQFIEGTMNANMYCDILKQSMIPSLQRLGRGAVFQHDNDHCLAKEAEDKGDGLAKHVSDLNPIEHLWGILKRKVEKRKVSNIHQLSDVDMEEWKRSPVATRKVMQNILFYVDIGT